MSTRLTLAVLALLSGSLCAAADPVESAAERWSKDGRGGTPSFTKHVVPLFAKVGCSARSCHGSFQGQNGFRLSLFGYDPQLDFGSVVAKEHQSPVGIPPFVSLPVGRSPGGVASPGYLGVAHSPFRVNEDPNAEDFSIRALSSPDGMPFSRVSARTALMKRLDTAFRDVDRASADLAGMDRFYQQAFDILRSPTTRKAFDLSQESDAVRDRFGRTSLGQACLLARRLVEVGVRCVTIDCGGWDTHKKNFTSMKDTLLPPWDQGLATLLEDLDERGLLDETFVWSTGEMGRTPTINKDAGRDHWGKAMSMVMAGGGIKTGQVLGATDEKGAEVTEVAGTPEDAAASALRALGIDHKKEYHTATGRPITIVHDGDPISALF